VINILTDLIDMCSIFLIYTIIQTLSSCAQARSRNLKMKADWFTIIQKCASKTKNNENESGFAHWLALLYTGEGYAPGCLYITVRFFDALPNVSRNATARGRPFCRETAGIAYKIYKCTASGYFYGLGTAFEIEKLVRKVTES
ncbi:hypothetical protein AAK943_16920, partial [Emergencia timonensis]|uniref:hypothetical protein n=3 Tax=Emergencia timonensis TaxID=1776384 RepID=UPI00351157A9